MKRKSNFSLAIMQARITVEKQFSSTARKRNNQPRTLYLSKIFFKNEGEIKTFSVTTEKNDKPADLHRPEILKEILQAEGK